MNDIKNTVLLAETHIRPYIRETPLKFSETLNTYLKCENLQHTGAFKVRGAFNKLLSLTPSQRKLGVATASTGNHGAAVAFGLKTLNIPGIIFVPENASPKKIINIRHYDATLEFFGTDCIQTELHAIEYAKKNNMIYVSPYNDLAIIAGQGTIGLELKKQLHKIDAIFVPIGGGGLISGIAGYIKSVSPETKIIGCLPKNSPVMAESIKAGRIIKMETLPTLSDATAGGIEPGAITFEFCQKYVDDYILVSESEIQDAMNTLIKTDNLKVEGAAGVALASLFQTAKKFEGKNTVVILSGGNINDEN